MCIRDSAKLSLLEDHLVYFVHHNEVLGRDGPVQVIHVHVHVSRAGIAPVSYTHLSEWKPEIAPQATVVNKMGNKS